MKNFPILFLLLFAPLFGKEQKICLNMIVKDETAVIERCLTSVKGLIDYWVIVDTGSTDGTQEVIKRFMKDIPGELHERPWVNFEHNRNEALDLAKGKGEYILFIDADEQLIFTPNFHLPLLERDMYVVPIREDASYVLRALLIADKLPWRWVGVLHEYISCPQATTSAVLEGVINSAEATDGHRAQDPDKHKKDAQVLEAALLKEPNNSRYQFYLAQAYWNGKEYEKALENFKKRVEMPGWDQETFWSLYSIGMCYEALHKDTATIMKAHSEAYQYRPKRIEPLARMAARYFEEGNYLLCYIIAKYALSHNLKPDDNVFVEYPIYDYLLFVLFADAASQVGCVEEAIAAYQQALQSRTMPREIQETVQRLVQENRAKLPIPCFSWESGSHR